MKALGLRTAVLMSSAVGLIFQHHSVLVDLCDDLLIDESG